MANKNEHKCGRENHLLYRCIEHIKIWRNAVIRAKENWELLYATRLQVETPTLQGWALLVLLRGYPNTSLADKIKFHPSFLLGLEKQNPKPMKKILLLERNPIFAAHLSELLEYDQLFEVVKICQHGSQVLDFLKKRTTEILIIDHLQTNGLEIVNRVCLKYPNIKTVLYSTYLDKEILKRPDDFGVPLFLDKYHTCSTTFLKAVKTILP